ncbi:CRE-DHS-2 protein [Aphelenchoides avenae]|nr:CRE-DHS-2 protein [Aphelenchus avenae]
MRSIAAELSLIRTLLSQHSATPLWRKPTAPGAVEVTAGFLGILIVYQIVRLVLDRIRIRDVTKKTVLITGCDTGFGFELALKCHRQGMLVFCGCYSKEVSYGGRGHKYLAILQGIERLERLDEGTRRMRPFSLDICSDESVEEAKRFVEKTLLDDGRELHYLVNNAGWGRVGFDDWLRPQDYLAAIDVNAVGMIRVTHAFKHMIKKSKLEMRRFGVKVITIAPGYFRTRVTSVSLSASRFQQVWDNAPAEVLEECGEKFLHKAQKLADNLLATTPNGDHTEWVVDAYYNAMTAVFPRQRYLVGYDAKYL